MVNHETQRVARVLLTPSIFKLYYKGKQRETNLIVVAWNIAI